MFCYGCASEPDEIVIEESKVEEPAYTREYVNNMINYYKDRIGYAEEIISAGRKLNYPEDHTVIFIAKQEIEMSKLNLIYFQAIEEQFIAEDKLWAGREKEYPIATAVWLYLKNLGYNDYICAGILGNMMAECGGGTLNLHYDIISSDWGFYGLCQWNHYYEGVWGKDLLGQLDFLRDTIEYEINTFGYAYKRNFNYESFLLLDNERTAAYVFATCYERCAKHYRNIRQDYAEIAYNYYVGE